MKKLKSTVKLNITRIVSIAGILLEIILQICDWHNRLFLLVVSFIIAVGILWWQIEFDNYKKNSVLLSNLYLEGKPMASDIEYLLESRNRPDEKRNELLMDEVHIIYEFTCIDKKKEKVIQKFTWNFKGKNQNTYNLMKFHFVSCCDEISNSLLIGHSAWDNLSNEELFVEVAKKNDAHNLAVNFNGEGIRSMDEFDFRILMEWKEAIKLSNYETILIDLDNYTSEEVGNVAVTIISDEDSFAKRQVSVYSVDRMTFNKELIYNTATKKSENNKYGVEFNLKRKKGQRLFLMCMRG